MAFFGSIFGAQPTAPGSPAPTEHDGNLYDAELMAEILEATSSRNAILLRLKSLLMTAIEADRAPRMHCAALIKKNAAQRTAAVAEAALF